MSHPVSTSTLTALQHLLEVVAQLRHPDRGCPWDLAQTPQTLIPYVLEEAYEVVDAIQQGEPEAIADELGDLLLQVVLQAQIASEAGAFDLKTVADQITEKLIRRHPHVFADVNVQNAAEVVQNWEQIKAAEEAAKANRDGNEPADGNKKSDGDEKANGNENGNRIAPRLSRYARSLPPMTAAMKISRKAAAVGFEWETVAGVWEKFEEELAEFKQALQSETKAEQQAELGDLLFTIINLARWYELDPEEGLKGTNQRFIQRFTQVEQAIAQVSATGAADEQRSLADYSLEELEVLWQQAKRNLGHG